MSAVEMIKLKFFKIGIGKSQRRDYEIPVILLRPINYPNSEAILEIWLKWTIKSLGIEAGNITLDLDLLLEHQQAPEVIVQPSNLIQKVTIFDVIKSSFFVEVELAPLEALFHSVELAREKTFVCKCSAEEAIPFAVRDDCPILIPVEIMREHAGVLKTREELQTEADQDFLPPQDYHPDPDKDKNLWGE
jgi:bifunctional DNase/RNase